MKVSELAGRLAELTRLGYGDCDVVVTDDGETILWTLGAEPPEPMRDEHGGLGALGETPPASMDRIVVALG
jgi:hypothetical protein